MTNTETTDWAEVIRSGQERVARLRERLNAGEDEATAMRAEGFSGERSINERVEAVRRAYMARPGR